MCRSEVAKGMAPSKAVLRARALTVSAMATPEGLARVAFEAVEDAHDDGCVLAEFRIAPLLFEAFGIAGEVAAERSAGPGTFRQQLIDAVAALDEATILTRTRATLRETQPA